MKHILIFFLCVSSFLISAQQVAEVRPGLIMVQNPMMPLVILEYFARNHPDAVPYWSCEGKNYTVRFEDPYSGMGHMLTFDRYGKILKSHDELRLEQCPESLRVFCERNYSVDSLRVWLYEDLRNGKRYYIRNDAGTLWFDKEGRPIRKRFLWI